MARPGNHPARATVPRTAVGPQVLRDRLALHRAAPPRREVLGPIRSRVSRCWSGRADAVHGAAERVRPALPGRACSGTGGRTSSTRSPTRRSRARETARSCRRGTRRCTSTRSTAPPPGCCDAPLRYRDGVGRRSSSASTPTLPTRADQAVDRTLGGAAPLSAGGAYVNFLMDEGRTGSGRRTAATTTGSPRSRTATTREPLPPQPEIRPAGGDS